MHRLFAAPYAIFPHRRFFAHTGLVKFNSTPVLALVRLRDRHSFKLVACEQAQFRASSRSILIAASAIDMRMC